MMIDNPINMDIVLNMEGISKTFPGVQALMKFRISGSRLNVEIYHNDGFGGPYSIIRTVKLICGSHTSD
ncbi:MAG TPA: hypothetical protein ENH49_06680 [Candidatus Marinimicrobia bacterium]|nr:hypothetical protein [Candidatus Neomarinimicrobiota bacterium]